jgi:hypothetical protein
MRFHFPCSAPIV